MSEKRVMRKTFEPLKRSDKRLEKCHNEQVHNICSLSGVSVVKWKRMILASLAARIHQQYNLEN
jgi:hypothetical protein